MAMTLASPYMEHLRFAHDIDLIEERRVMLHAVVNTLNAAGDDKPQQNQDTSVWK